jgi:hypothetical protein
VRGSVPSPAPTAVVRSSAQDMPGLRGTINGRCFFVLWEGRRQCGRVVAAHTGQEAYATGWMHRPLSMGQKQRARINQNLEYGAIRRLPMRSEVAWRGEPGLPHGTMWRGHAARAFLGNKARSSCVTKSRPAIPIGITEISRGSSAANTPGTPAPQYQLHPVRGA